MSIIETIEDMRALLIEQGAREPFRVKMNPAGYAQLRSEFPVRAFAYSESGSEVCGMGIDIVPGAELQVVPAVAHGT